MSPKFSPLLVSHFLNSLGTKKSTNLLCQGGAGVSSNVCCLRGRAALVLNNIFCIVKSFKLVFVCVTVEKRRGGRLVWDHTFTHAFQINLI